MRRRRRDLPGGARFQTLLRGFVTGGLGSMHSELKFLSDDEIKTLREALAARYGGAPIPHDFEQKLAMLAEWAGRVRYHGAMLEELLGGRLHVADVKNGEPVFALAPAGSLGAGYAASSR